MYFYQLLYFGRYSIELLGSIFEKLNMSIFETLPVQDMFPADPIVQSTGMR